MTAPCTAPIKSDRSLDELDAAFESAYGDTVQDVWLSIKGQVLYLASSARHHSPRASEFLRIKDPHDWAVYVSNHFLIPIEAAGWPHLGSVALMNAIRDAADRAWPTPLVNQIPPTATIDLGPVVLNTPAPITAGEQPRVVRKPRR